MLKSVQRVVIISFAFLLSNCITQFIPQVNEDKELLVVEGLITDRPDTNTIKLSRSRPLGARAVAKPVKGCLVTISDDLGNTFNLEETVDGTYVTDPSIIRGVAGRLYTLHINTNGAYNSLNYESYPVEMKPVPPIDSLFYEKETIKENPDGTPSAEGCQIYLSTHDPANQNKFYKWDFSETWEFSLPYFVA